MKRWIFASWFFVPALLCAAQSAPTVGGPISADAAEKSPRLSRESRFKAGLAVGGVWTSRNDVRIPGDAGTKFDLTDLTGSGPEPSGRVWLHWNFRPRHAARLTVVPFRVSGTGRLDDDVHFRGAVFQGGIPTKGTYRFDTYRVTYLYRFHEDARWDWHAGGTVLVRDAEITLEQAGRSATKTNVGVVPLIHLSGERRLTERWRGRMEFDGLAGGPGRAFDVGVQGLYAVSERWEWGLGYRTIEGGSDTDAVFTFGWFNAIHLIASCQF